MREENKEIEVKLTEKESEEANAGRRLARHDDGVAQTRRPSRAGHEGGEVRRTINVEQ